MSHAPRPEPGSPVEFRWRKWDASPHWVHECVYLGSDEWGDWLGQLPGWSSARPGRIARVTEANVTLVPPSGDYACTINAAPHLVRIYIDVAWNVEWSPVEPGVVTGIDMDLDVVRALDERGLFIDDRDEWEEHRLRYGYPVDVQRHLEALALDLERRVGRAAPPFDDASAERWLARLGELTEGTA